MGDLRMAGYIAAMRREYFEVMERTRKVSHDAALRDINDLIAKGVPVREAAGGRSTSYSLR